MNVDRAILYAGRPYRANMGVRSRQRKLREIMRGRCRGTAMVGSRAARAYRQGMTRLFLPMAALSMIAALPATAQPAEDNAQVRAAADAFNAAQQRGDGAALERLLAPDFLFVRGSGRIGDRRDFIAGFTNPASKMEPFVIRDPLFLRVSADVAIVGGEAWIKGIENGKPITEHFRYSDTFARRDGRWMAVYTQITGLPTQ